MPLHLAVAEGYADIVGVLLTNGADPYACRTVMVSTKPMASLAYSLRHGNVICSI